MAVPAIIAISVIEIVDLREGSGVDVSMNEIWAPSDAVVGEDILRMDGDDKIAVIFLWLFSEILHDAVLVAPVILSLETPVTVSVTVRGREEKSQGVTRGSRLVCTSAVMRAVVARSTASRYLWIAP